MTTYLLDVNLLPALTDPRHIHHQVARCRFAEKGQQAWATCALTKNGFVRIYSHPHYPNRPGEATVVPAIHRQLCEAPGHQFWAEDISIRQIIEADAIITHAQITDVYLLGLAVHRNSKLATLDQRIPSQAVRRGRKALELITS